MSEPYLPGVEAPEAVGHIRRAWRHFSASQPAASFLAGGLIAVGAYFVLPADVQSVVFVVVALSAAAALVTGARLHLNADLLPWFLFAAGQLAFAVGDSIFGYYELALAREPPFPSIADVVYLAGYPLLVGAIFLLIRGLRDVEGHFAVVDATTIAIGFGLVQWVFVIDPQIDETVSVAERLALIAYPAMDALLLGALARFFLAAASRTRAYWYLVLAIVLLLMADEFYAVAPDSYVAGSWIDALWLGSYVFWGAAALDPSMRRLSDAGSEEDPHLSWSRLGLLTAALLAAPTVLVLEVGREDRFPALVAFAASAALAVLVLVRALGFDAYVFQRERTLRAQQDAIRRLSVRIRRVHEEILVLDISDALALTDQVLTSIRDSRAKVVVVDVEDVDAREARGVDGLRDIVETLERMGMNVIIAGASVELAQRASEIGASVEADLSAGLEKAEQLLGYTRLRVEQTTAEREEQ